MTDYDWNMVSGKLINVYASDWKYRNKYQNELRAYFL